jgi:methionyl-tRNA formyltransferase
VRTVYLGTTEFAATVLQHLAASEHRPGLVVTRPDRPRGRGRRLGSPPVAETARELGIELDQPESVNSDQAVARIAAARPEAVCLCAFGALIREPLLSDHEIVNVHPSLLPRWRGAAPVERAIQAGDMETGVTIMRLEAELDSGPVYLAAHEPIRADDDYGSLAPRLAGLGGELLVRALGERPDPVPQPEEGVTYAEKIDRAERRLDPEQPAEQLARTVRALTPHIGAFVELAERERLGVRRARPLAGDGPARGELGHDDERLLFGTADGALELLEVHPPGGRPMDAGAYLRGRVRPDRQDSYDG